MKLKTSIQNILSKSEQTLAEAALEELNSGSIDARLRFRLTQLTNVLCDRPQIENEED